jgi:hypothetical protein
LEKTDRLGHERQTRGNRQVKDRIGRTTDRQTDRQGERQKEISNRKKSSYSLNRHFQQRLVLTKKIVTRRRQPKNHKKSALLENRVGESTDR